MFKESFGGRGDVGVHAAEVPVWEVDSEGRHDWNLPFCGDFLQTYPEVLMKAVGRIWNFGTLECGSQSKQARQSRREQRQARRNRDPKMSKHCRILKIQHSKLPIDGTVFFPSKSVLVMGGSR